MKIYDELFKIFIRQFSLLAALVFAGYSSRDSDFIFYFFNWDRG